MESKPPDNAVALIESFESYFSVNLACKDEDKSKAFHIRYRVYCEEFGYEEKENCPNEQEKDEFDDSSYHCVIIHKRLEIPAGCVRLVPAVGPNGEGLLPFEKFCGQSLDRSLIDSYHLDRSTICEISRLAVDSAFRRRTGESLTRFGRPDSLDISQVEERTFSLIAVSGFLAATALTELSGKTNVFAMMEPFLPRLLKRSGIVFEKVGQDIDYHGIRAPYFIKTQSALENMNPSLKEMYDWIFGQVEAKLLTR